MFHFKDAVILKVEEKTGVVLNFTESGYEGSYKEISWDKDVTTSTGRIVLLHPSVTEGQPWYYNDYCATSSPCNTSSKGELNVDTGDFTIYRVNISDGGFYYYDFYIDGGPVNTGQKYEIDMEVYGEFTLTV